MAAVFNSPYFLSMENIVERLPLLLKLRRSTHAVNSFDLLSQRQQAIVLEAEKSIPITDESV